MQKTQPVPHPLHVITMISNPRRYRSRYDLYHKFAKHMQDTGAILHTVEVSYGDRPFELVSQGEEIIRLNTNSEVWIKENAINIAFSRLPADAKYIAWVDADVHFVRHDWVHETIHMLQHHPVVQCWSTAHDLDPNYEIFDTYTSFAACYRKGLDTYASKDRSKDDPVFNLGCDPYYGIGKKPKTMVGNKNHPGYAWAATRDALNHLGGLIDIAIVGSADSYMAMGLIGLIENTFPNNCTNSYKDRLLEWQARAEKHILRNIGFVNGSITHHWHGKKSARGYVERWKILSKHQFDPLLDLKYDIQGLHQLTTRNPRLRDDLMHYFSSRNEDGIDTE